MQITNSLDAHPKNVHDGTPWFKVNDAPDDFHVFCQQEGLSEKEKLLLAHFIDKKGINDSYDIKTENFSGLLYNEDYLDKFTEKNFYEEKIAQLQQVLCNYDEKLLEHFDVDICVKEDMLVEESLDSSTLIKLNLHNKSYVAFLVDKYTEQYKAYRDLCTDLKKMPGMV